MLAMYFKNCSRVYLNTLKRSPFVLRQQPNVRVKIEQTPPGSAFVSYVQRLAQQLELDEQEPCFTPGTNTLERCSGRVVRAARLW